MKKILILLNAAFLTAAIFFGCQQSSSIPVPVDCPTCFKKCYDGVELKGEIPGEVVYELSKRYADDPGKGKISRGDEVIIDPNHDPGTFKKKDGFTRNDRDALSMVFELDRIKNLVWKMENAVCDSGCPATTTLGIRFYYITYPKKGEDKVGLENIPDEARGKHALVMVPAYLNSSNGEWYDFDYRSVLSICRFLKIPYHGISEELAPMITGVSGNGTNHGGIGPPPDPGTFPTNPPQ